METVIDQLQSQLDFLGLKVDLPEQFDDIYEQNGVIDKTYQFLLSEYNKFCKPTKDPSIVIEDGVMTYEKLLNVASQLGYIDSVRIPDRNLSVYLLFSFIAGEIQSLKLYMSSLDKLEFVAAPSEAEVALRISLALSIPKFSAAPEHFEKSLEQIRFKLEKLLRELPEEFMSETESDRSLLLSADFAQDSEKSGILEHISQLFRREYGLRRTMLLKRLDVTLDSFLSSSRVQNKGNEILESIEQRRKSLSPLPLRVQVDDIADVPVYVARVLAQVSRSHASSSLGKKAKAVQIGNVPDRGGRVDEMRSLAGAYLKAKKEAANGPKVASGNTETQKMLDLLDEARRFEGEAGTAFEELVEVIKGEGDAIPENSDVQDTAEQSKNGMKRSGEFKKDGGHENKKGKWRGGNRNKN